MKKLKQYHIKITFWEKISLILSHTMQTIVTFGRVNVRAFFFCQNFLK